MSVFTKRLAKLKKLIAADVHVRIAGCNAWIGKLKSNGIPVMVVFRRGEQMQRGAHATMTEARKAGVLSWPLDADLLSYYKGFYGIRYVWTVERDTGDLWVSKIEDWSDDTLLYKQDPLAKRPFGMGSGTLRYLPVHHHLHIPAEAELLSRAQ